MRRPAALATLAACAVLAAFVIAQASPDGPTLDERLQRTAIVDPVKRIVTDPRRPGVAYVTTERGSDRAYRSLDDGHTWIPVAPDHAALRKRFGIRFDDFEVLAIDPSSSATIYGVADWLLLRSTDGGETWRPVTPPSACHERGARTTCLGGLQSTVYGLAIAPGSPDALYAAAYTDGLLTTTDGGRRWRRVTELRSARVRAVAVGPVRSGAIYVVTERGGLLKSRDGGSTWRTLAPRVNVGLGDAEPPAIPRGRPATVYVRGDGLDVSDDHGRSWRTVHPDLLVAGEPQALSALAIDPNHPRTLYLSVADHVENTTLLLASTDAGLSWSILARGSGTSARSDTTLTFEPLAVGREVVYVGTNDGLLLIPGVS